ncbi:syntaxin-52-like [Pistacia vera]|uniref:syntaxin-52-like n=1 Tax=Pistacia vera TaxID=55513 RepID=UPI001262CEEB|nr:syntaxin-52-like [Pistacia vera]
MSKNLAIDAWVREAQEAVKLVEDIETRVKNKSLKQEENQLRLRDDIARSKLFEVGVKLDRLESLLHNPPSKPILTNEDLEYRWKMLSDIQLRTKSLALCLYAMPSSNRSEGLPVADTKETNKKDGSYDHDQNKSSFAENEPELLKPLVSDDSPQSDMQITHCSSFIDSMPLFCKVCGIICSILGAVAFLFVLVILCAVL